MTLSSGLHAAVFGDFVLTSPMIGQSASGPPAHSTSVHADSVANGNGVVARRSGAAGTVFVIGPPRSGTTLLSYLMAGGEKVLSLSEPFRLQRVFPNWGLRWTFWRLQRSAGLLRMPAPRYTDGEGFLSYMREVAVANGLRHLVIKETYRSDRAWANVGLLDWFVKTGEPMAVIIRHPYDAAVSTLRMFRLWRGIVGKLVRPIVPDLPLFSGDREIVEYFAESWLSFVAWCKFNGLHLTRYEDLVSEPEPRLREICNRCGLPFDERMLDHRHARGPFGGIGDPGVMARPARPVSARSVGRKRQLPNALRRIIADRCAATAACIDYAV